MEMKNKKAEGVDRIPAEFFKVLGEKASKELYRLCREMYEGGVWPKDFQNIVLIPVQKTTNAIECSDHRTISLIPHASKILLKILTKRIAHKVKDFLGRNQFGFRRGCGTREAIGVLKMICERSMEHGNDVYICFVDFEKAFDRVNWVKMMKVLTSLGIDLKDRKMIKELYLGQEAIVRVAEGESKPCKIGRGVRQGCPLSPLLFSIYSEMMMKEAIEDIEEGVKIGGEFIKDIKFADDQGIVANSELGLQTLMDALITTAGNYDMKVNVRKTKTMIVSKHTPGDVNISLDGRVVEQVKKFRYLGVIMTEDGRCDLEIKTRIAMAKDAFSKRRELLVRSMNIKTKKRIIKAVVWSVAMYGCETWTMRKDTIQRLKALEMWIWRRMEKVSWKDRKTNEEVLQTIGEKRSLIETIVNRKKNWIGHILRGDGLMKDVMEGRMEGKRVRGRRRKGMLDDLIDGTYAELKRRAEDRVGWRGWTPRTCLTAEHL